MDAVIKSKIRQLALKLAIGKTSQVSFGRETSAGEFNIDFSLGDTFGKVNIRITRISGGYVSIIHARVIGNERQFLWDYRFFDNHGHHLTGRTKFVENNHL